MLIIKPPSILVRDKSPNSSAEKNRKYAQTYEKLVSDQLVIENQEGVVFLRPTEFEVPKPPPSIKEADNNRATRQIVAISAKNVEGTLVPLGGIEIASIHSQTSISESELADAAKKLTSKNSGNQEGNASIKEYINSRLSFRFIVSYGKTEPFKNSNLNSPAWQTDFTAKAKPVDKPLTKPEDLKGKGVFLLGKSAFYYLMIYSTDYNWEANQDTWQKVLNSIKIDQ